MLSDARHALKALTYRFQKIPGSWETKETRIAKLSLDHPQTKQPGSNYLYVQGFEAGEHFGVCLRDCCRSKFAHCLDALVGQVGVLFDPDWYQGNWWETRPRDNPTSGAGHRNRRESDFRYYGVSNAILRHPALLHTIMGLFRQAVLIHTQDLDHAVHDLVPRKDVEKALSEGNPGLALRNLRKIRPWVEVANSARYRYFPFPRGYWNRLPQIHKAIYRHGFEELFGGSLEEGWRMTERGFNGALSGAWSYWGDGRLTSAGQRLARLGK
jgi:hypothetical protein